MQAVTNAKPTADDIQKVINNLIWERDADLEDIILACYRPVIERYMYSHANNLPYEKWSNLSEAIEPFLFERNPDLLLTKEDLEQRYPTKNCID
jgi:hypothetical protein